VVHLGQTAWNEPQVVFGMDCMMTYCPGPRFQQHIWLEKGKDFSLPDSSYLPSAPGTRQIPITLGKHFADGHPRQSAHNKVSDGKPALCRELSIGHSAPRAIHDPQQKRSLDGKKTVTAGLPSARMDRHSTKFSNFFEKEKLCRVPPCRHSAKILLFLF
jgi:hypothetical protein